MGQKPEGSRRSEYWGSPQDRLFAASQLKNIIEIRWALEDGADPNGRDADGSSPLHYVCWSGSAECVDELLKAGASATARDDKGETPLHLAASEESEEIVRMLISAGANLEAVGKKGWRPLHEAAMSAPLRVVRALLDAGADPFARSEAGAFDALSLARQNEDPQAMESLREIWARREAEEIGEAAPARAPGISRGGRPL